MFSLRKFCLPGGQVLPADRMQGVEHGQSRQGCCKLRQVIKGFGISCCPLWRACHGSGAAWSVSLSSYMTCFGCSIASPPPLPSTQLSPSSGQSKKTCLHFSLLWSDSRGSYHTYISFPSDLYPYLNPAWGSHLLDSLRLKVESIWDPW